MTRVVVAGLKKSFGSHRVLTGVDLDVPEGSLTAVLGASGSGKTTLLRILAGFEKADGGSVRIGGVVVEGPRAHLAPETRGIGYVPQEGSLFPHLDAAGNVGFGLRRRERKQRAGELLALVGLSGQGHLYPHQLSGGQQQRVALARALAVRPSLVLLDEPFSSLDAALRAEVRADVARALAETGTTAVLVTHDQDEALSLADRVAVLRDGVVAQCAGPEELYSRPADPHLARFVGEANIVEGSVRGGMVRTALGELALADGSRHVGDAEAVLVLVRPEQVQLESGATGQGLGGRVTQCHFYGHDMLVTVEVGQDGTRSTVQARLAGRAPLAIGAAVSLRVAGPVKAWPARTGAAAG
ncbi:MAG: ABC transporter ATP-binding protein [Acidimicrobiales bacterium]